MLNNVIIFFLYASVMHRNKGVSYSEVVITLDFESSIRRSNRRKRNLFRSDLVSHSKAFCSGKKLTPLWSTKRASPTVRNITLDHSRFVFFFFVTDDQQC
mmetsp:Transcript_4207/g.9163  ORF Transcript_4207/g.9163 Transcript_4207/m.9163 type:complete len:100 (+) Transcript_4207:233-532(+)